MAWAGSLLTRNPLPLFGEVASSSLPLLIPRTWNDQEYACKCYLGDDCWPSQNSWNDLNTTVEGNLIVNVPPGAVCYNVRPLSETIS